MYVIKKTKKKLISLMLAAALVAVCAIQAGAAPIGSSAAALNVPARAAILIEKETGTVIYEKDADTKREPASVTKIMTILLIVEALDSGSLTLDDIVTTSAHAQSMGGSQIYLSEGERMSVHEMLKAIVVASANDAATAMAEHLAGSEPVFAERMNERARQLGMTNTHFTNASGLLDDTTHVTTARDVSLMARELIGHNFIKQYTTIWTDSVRGGSFSLTNTNKLIHSYSGASGLKTGFTSRAGHCLTATANRDGVEYIAVVLGGDTSDARFSAAQTLLDYAFANFTLIDASPDEILQPVRVELGKPKYVQPIIEGAGKLLVTRDDAAAIEKSIEISDLEQAPLAAGEQLGRFILRNGERVIGEYAIVAGEDVSHVTWSDVFIELVTKLFS